MLVFFIYNKYWAALGLNVKWALKEYGESDGGMHGEKLPDNGAFHLVLFLIVNTSYMERLILS